MDNICASYSVSQTPWLTFRSYAGMKPLCIMYVARKDLFPFADVKTDIFNIHHAIVHF